MHIAFMQVNNTTAELLGFLKMSSAITALEWTEENTVISSN